jgi:hypothetical protein
MGDRPDAYLHRTAQYKKTQIHTSMPRAEFEPMIPVFERPKTVDALDRTDIGTGCMRRSVEYI